MAKEGKGTDTLVLGGDKGNDRPFSFSDKIKKIHEDFATPEEKGDGPGSDELPRGDPGADITEGLNFSPKRIRRLIALPGELAFLKSKNEKDRLSPEEIATLSEDATETLNTFVRINPKWLGPIMFTINGLMIYGPRLQIIFSKPKPKVEEPEKATA
jgi:hypothetical protein